jgi:hypothetical protein
MYNQVNETNTVSQHIEGGCPCGYHQAFNGVSTYDQYVTYLKTTRPSSEHNTIKQLAHQNIKTILRQHRQLFPQDAKIPLRKSGQDLHDHLKALHDEGSFQDEAQGHSSETPAFQDEATQGSSTIESPTLRQLLFSVEQCSGYRAIGGIRSQEDIQDWCTNNPITTSVYFKIELYEERINSIVTGYKVRQEGDIPEGLCTLFLQQRHDLCQDQATPLGEYSGMLSALPQDAGMSYMINIQ